MLGLFAIGLAVLLLLHVARRTLARKQRRGQRQVRRHRHRMHERLWNQIMVRPKMRRLTFEDRSR